MDEFAVTDRTRLSRRPQRGRYDRETIHAILDAGLLCHVGYVQDGQPKVVPTLYWRDGDRVYWHGAREGAAMALAAAEAPVCLTVSHLDGLVAARAAFFHSVSYRSVIAYGSPVLVDAPDEKLSAMRGLFERLYPGRWEAIRPPSEAELAAISVVYLELEEVSAKVKTGPPMDADADLDRPVWAGVLPLALAAGAPEPCPKLPAGTPIPDHIARWAVLNPPPAN